MKSFQLVLGTFTLHFQLRLFSKRHLKLGLIETDAHNVSILTGNGVSPAIIMIQIGFTVYHLLISVSLIETSFMNQTQDLFLILFLHMAINMLKKIDQRATNVRTQTLESYYSDICLYIHQVWCSYAFQTRWWHPISAVQRFFLFHGICNL